MWGAWKLFLFLDDSSQNVLASIAGPGKELPKTLVQHSSSNTSVQEAAKKR